MLRDGFFLRPVCIHVFSSKWCYLICWNQNLKCFHSAFVVQDMGSQHFSSSFLSQKYSQLPSDLFAHTIWMYFVCLYFQHMKIGGNFFNQILFQTCFALCLFPSVEYAQFWVFCGACVSLTTSPCCSVGLCTMRCVISALNSWASQSKACISAAKYKCSPLFWKLC